MEEQLDNSRGEILWELLANPAGKGSFHAYNLQQLVRVYPHSGLLQALLLYTGDESNLQHAAAYFNPLTLYKIANLPDTLGLVDAGQIVSQLADVPDNGHFHTGEAGSTANENVTHERENHIIAAPAVERPQQPAVEDVHGEITPPMHDNNWNTEPPAHQEIEPPMHDNNWAEEPVAAEAGNHVGAPEAVADTHTGQLPFNLIKPYVEEMPVNQTIPAENEQPVSYAEHEENHSNSGDEQIEVNQLRESVAHEQAAAAADADDEYSFTAVEPVLPSEINEKQHINEETFDEIVGIEDISLAHEHKPAETAAPGTGSRNSGPRFNNRELDLNDEAEKLILNNIAATDFFVFDRAFSDHKDPSAADEPEPPAGAGAGQVVSKYNDEKMPYSFLWWLDKTRKEHAGVYQPYVEFKLDTTQSIGKNADEELQQQYYENIFHDTSIEELEKSTNRSPVKFDPKKKEDEIIERFIQEVPQIKPPGGDKLDNENKAKKSSEDDDEIVTETLARVYADQMLFPKAISVYKKLMLKYPEKSSYFASQIEQLEKRNS